MRLEFILFSLTSNLLQGIKKMRGKNTLLTCAFSRTPSFGIPVKSSQLDLPKTKAYADGDSTVKSETSMEISIDGWDGITLEYSVDWPLQLFFTHEVLSK